jgi:hypothetical protein
MTIKNPFKYFKTSPEIIRLAVMYYLRYPLSLRQVEDICMSGASISAMRLSVFGGIDLVLGLQKIFARIGLGTNPTGAGILMKSSSKLTV